MPCVCINGQIVVNDMGKGYDEAYYNQYDMGDRAVNYLESPEIRTLHAAVAKALVEHFHPGVVLDAGCAMGVLVAEFRKLGVDAYGLDFSEYAVSHADIVARSSCFCGSLADPFPTELPERFDLVTCIEVVEHMSPEDGRKAIRNLCNVSDTVIFCSTPDDLTDPTHVNVQQREYWAACFAENGFYDDLDFRPIFLTDYAVCYRKRDSFVSQVEIYEHYIRQTDEKLRDYRDSHYLALEREHEKAVAEWTRTAEELLQLRDKHQKLEADAQDSLLRAECAEEKLQTLDEKLESMNRQYGELETEHQQTLSEYKKNLLRAECAEEKLQTLDEKLESLNRQYGELENAHKQTLSEYNVACQHLGNALARVAALESSLSWRITKPLRVSKRFCKRAIGRSARKVFHLLKRVRSFTHRTRTRVIHFEKNWPPRVARLADGTQPMPVATDCRRACVYTFYDADGVVDGYVLFFLKALRPWVEKLLVVSNGPVRPEGISALEEIGCEVLIRENRGFDAWGVKTGIEHLGFDFLAQLDELIVANNTLFGPVRDLRELFSSMACQKVDFWGIVSHPGMPDMDPFGCNPYGYIPAHVQSFLYGVRGRLLRSEAFHRFWTELPELPDYNAAVGLYETVMTRFFSDAGFIWNCYLKPEDYYDMTDNPLIAMPVEAIRDWNCPVFKRRAFFQDYDYLSTFTGQHTASCLLDYLSECTDYPVELVWRNLIRTCHMSDLSRNLHLLRVFDRENRYALSPGQPKGKVALFMHIYDHDMAEELASYAANLPADADIFISTVSQKKKEVIAAAFSHLPNRVEIRVLPNRGRDVSALLTSFRDVVMDYDVACVTHDKKTGYLKPQTVGEGFAYMGYENILGSKTFVAQVVQAFDQDPFLGLLCAPDPNHADFATHIGLEWGANFQCTKQLAEKLGLNVPMDADHPPMAPFGSSFWFRTKAMVPLFARAWTYEDFPEEPFGMTDGSILHAIERIYPFVAQHAGYYTAMLMTADYASLDIGNLTYYAQRYVHVCFENGVANRFVVVRQLCDQRMGLPVSDGQSVPNRNLLRRILEKLYRVLSRWAEE